MRFTTSLGYKVTPSVVLGDRITTEKGAEMPRPISKKTQQAIDRELARRRLREMLEGVEKPVIHTVLRHVSQSGMSRDISLKLVDKDGDLVDITYTASEAMGEKVKDRNGWRVIRVNGCGMDMGFHLVYNLSYELYKHDTERAGYVIRHEWA